MQIMQLITDKFMVIHKHKMAKKISKPKEDLHGLTPEQFAEWELLEINLELYKKQKGI